MGRKKIPNFLLPSEVKRGYPKKTKKAAQELAKNLKAKGIKTYVRKNNTGIGHRWTVFTDK